MVVLHRVVDHPEPRPLRPPAQRLPERPHEARPAQRRHVVRHPQRDQHRAVARDRLAAPVRHPGPARPRPPRPGPSAAAAGRPERERGLPGILPASPLHCGGHRRLGTASGSKVTPGYCICQQYFGGNRTFLGIADGLRRPARQRNIAPFNRDPRRFPERGKARPAGCPCRPPGLREARWPAGPGARTRRHDLRTIRAMFGSGGTSAGGLSPLVQGTIPPNNRGAVGEGWTSRTASPPRTAMSRRDPGVY